MNHTLRDVRLARHSVCILLCGLAVLGLVLLAKPNDVAATPPTPAPMPLPGASPSRAPESELDAGTAQPAPPVEPTTATIVFATTPPATATVVWGRKLLGKITPGKPLVVVRPRDSGPLDVLVRAAGYLAVQTRAHTFSDNRVIVKLTPPENKSELFGYRAPLDAGVEPEQGAALDAVSQTPLTPLNPDTSFRVVPVTPAPAPAPSPWLVPP